MIKIKKTFDRVDEIEAIPWKLSRLEKKFIIINFIFAGIFVFWMYKGVRFEGDFILGIPKNIFGSWVFGILGCLITVLFGLLQYKDIHSRMNSIKEENQK